MNDYISLHANLLNQMPNFIGIVTEDNKFKFSNDNMAKLMGFKKGCDLINIHFSNMKCQVSEDAELFANQNKQVFLKKRTITTFGFHNCASGWTLTIANKFPLYSNNLLVGVMVNFMSVTDFNLIDYSRFLLNLDKKFNSKKSFSYILEDGKVNDHKLSSRQMECLFFMLRGKTNNEIAKILKLSPRTVETHLDQIKFKMGCSNKHQIIEKSIYDGLFNFIPERIFNKFKLNISS